MSWKDPREVDIQAFKKRVKNPTREKYIRHHQRQALTNWNRRVKETKKEFGVKSTQYQKVMQEKPESKRIRDRAGDWWDQHKPKSKPAKKQKVSKTKGYDVRSRLNRPELGSYGP